MDGSISDRDRCGGSDWVNAPGVNRLIAIPLLGFGPGPIVVSGQRYDFPAGMTAFNGLP